MKLILGTLFQMSSEHPCRNLILNSCFLFLCRKFASHYVKRDFYFDVHPPLGKVLLGLSALFAGYDGSFPFESGKEYPSNVNYSVMRMFCALWGALMVPLAYMTARELKFSRWASFAAATMILCGEYCFPSIDFVLGRRFFETHRLSLQPLTRICPPDNAFTVISRFILLDSMLLFFTALSFYCFVKFHNTQREPFSLDWWLWLSLVGFSLGLVSRYGFRFS
jgi:dolichyl-phosphate-mannose-protein mannosyltransferase